MEFVGDTHRIKGEFYEKDYTFIYCIFGFKLIYWMQ